MNIIQENKLDELIKKVDELQKQIDHQNNCIIDQSLIIHKLIEKLVILPTYPSTPSIDPHFGKDIPWVPYKGPDCENREMTPVYHKSYDGTLTPLPISTPEKWQMPKAGSVTESSSGSIRMNKTSF